MSKLIIRRQLISVNDNGKETELASTETTLDSDTALTMLGNLPSPGQATALPGLSTPPIGGTA